MNRLISTLLLLCAVFGGNLLAQATLSVQGVIKNSDGSAVDNGKYDLTFKLYAAETGGAAIWTEEQPQLTVTGGIYSALLGSVATLNVPFNQTYYLGVAVDGGAEMTPRIRLTSAPYALSLVGQSNVFPSTGNVGVGTNSPSQPLHVVGNGAVTGNFGVGTTSPAAPLHIVSSNEASHATPGGLVVGATNTTNLTFDGDEIQARNNGGTATLNLNPAGGATRLAHSGSYFLEATYDNLNAYSSPGTASTLYLNYYGGGVSIGNSNSINTVQGALSIGGVANWYFCNLDWIDNTGIHDFPGCSATYPFAVVTNARIQASEFWATSDRRIKKDFQPSDSGGDLSTLRKLNVRNYRHVDFVNNGKELKKGFVAQEVKAVFPESVTLKTDVIPSIYAPASQFSVANGNLSVSLEKPHELAPGDQVKLIWNEKEALFQVASVPGEKQFTVTGWKERLPEKLFVYGKQVADFHTVDYDRIFTLNVSATQELARRMEELEKENQELRRQNQALRSDFESRLLKLESQAGGSAER